MADDKDVLRGRLESYPGYTNVVHVSYIEPEVHLDVSRSLVIPAITRMGFALAKGLVRGLNRYPNPSLGDLAHQ
jgi:hypothetical protein